VILARLSTGVLVVDELLGVRIVNEAASSILGGDLAAAAGRPLPEVAAGNERLTYFIAAVAERLREHRSEWREQIALPPDRVIACACTPLAEEAGETGYVIVFDDITLLLQAQRDAAWGEVARRLAHEIKNPLTPIQLAAERLQRRLAGKLPPEDGELLERSTNTIVHQVEALKQMVNAFSEYARTPELTLTDFDLNALVTEVAELYRGQDPAIEIRVAADPALTRIHADRGRLRQVLNNLITNGIEAVGEPSGGWVEVSTTLAAGTSAAQVIIAVSDNGHGFQKEMLARVFDPYVTSKQKGTGLGLAIVKRIIEEHGGRIEADNRSEGGAQVRVILPVAERVVSLQPQRDIA
jgi:nitrogen fixation/metabolism regulation signal transduction histidine kinase